MGLPHISNPITLRASAVLPAAGAWDATPLEVIVSNLHWITLYISFTRGEAAGVLDLQLQWSPYSQTVAVVQNWFPMTAYATGGVAAGADTTSLTQREIMSYTPTGAAIENFIYGPVEFRDTAQRLRVLGRDIGVQVAEPGTLHIVGVATQAQIIL